MNEVNPQQVAESMWARDRASNKLGMKLGTVKLGYAEITMTVADDMVNGHDICHGGFLFSLADSAFAFACNACNRNTVAAQCQITFLRPAKRGDQLTAVCREMSRSTTSGVYDVEVVNQAIGKPVALFRGYSREVGGAVAPELSEKD